MAHDRANTAGSGSGSGSGSTSASAGAGAGSSSATSLARGKACLRCRKRKMRCDGAHPACAQCVRAHKPDACQYDDGRGKTRTQAMRERIARLEAELQLLRDGRGGDPSMGSPGGPGGREDSIFLMDPHAPPPPPSSSGSESGTFGGEFDFVDFGADAFGPGSGSVVGGGMDIERPLTSLSDPSSTSASGPLFTSEPFSFNEPDEYEGGVQRNRTIRPRDRIQQTSGGSGGLREPMVTRERTRPSSGVFGYSANHPLVQQAQGYGSASPFQGQFIQQGHSHSRTSSTGSPSPSSSTVGSIGGHGQHMGASPYSSYADPLSLEVSPFASPDPAMFAASVPSFAAARLDRDLGMGLSAETEMTLVQLVLAHRDQFGFVLHPGRLLSAFTSPSPDAQRPPLHPVLKDALTLVGAYLARRACGTTIISELAEKAILKRAESEMSDALRLATAPSLPGRLEGSASPPGPGRGTENYGCTAALDALQAHILLARYLFVEGRVSEARVHAASASDLVLQLGMHTLRSSSSVSAAADDSVGDGGMLRLPSPTDSVAMGERVALFWAVFVLDRMVATALGLPPCIADDECVETRVDTPWPEEVEEYENIPMESIQATATLRSFFLNQGMQVAGASLGGFAPLALLAKAAALYTACSRTSANWGIHSLASPPSAIFISSSTCSPSRTAEQGTGNNSLSADDPSMAFARLETCLARLASTLLPSHQLAAGLPDAERRKQVVLHTLVHASVARLHVRLARAGVSTSLEKCVRAARAGAALVRAHVWDKDYAVLDPVFVTCWTALADIFTLEPVQASAATPGSPASAWVPQDHGLLLSALARMHGASDAQGTTYSGMDSNPGSGK